MGVSVKPEEHERGTDVVLAQSKRAYHEGSVLLSSGSREMPPDCYALVYWCGERTALSW